jgi:hypothetical protein
VGPLATSRGVLTDMHAVDGTLEMRHRAHGQPSPMPQKVVAPKLALSGVQEAASAFPGGSVGMTCCELPSSIVDIGAWTPPSSASSVNQR